MLERGIVVSTHKSTKLFYYDLLNSLYGCKYPLVVVCNTEENNQYELLGLKSGMMLFSNFVYLHDTVLIKDLTLFDKLFEYNGMVSIGPNFISFLGKYNSDILKGYTLPEVKNKRQAVELETWIGSSLTYSCLFNDFTDVSKNSRFERIHDRMNLVIENEYLKKMKATWNITMIKD